MKELPNRKNIRLKEHNYSSTGYYFVTLCVKDGHEMLWVPMSVGARIARPSSTEIGKCPPLSEIGKIIEKAIKNIPQIYTSIRVDKYVIMPNHIHIIMVIDNNRGRAVRAPTISTAINQMKGYVTKQIGYSIWQKLFHDHIIHNEAEYQRIWQYIDENPTKWTEDCYFVKG